MDSLLLRAVKSGDVNEVNKLLEKGANPNFHYVQPEGSLLHFTSSGEIAQSLIKHGARLDVLNHDGDTPIIQAVRNRYSDVVKILLESGASVIDGTGETVPNVLFLAIYNNKGNTEIIRMLIKYGAKVNRSPSDPCHPLHHAVQCNNLEAIAELIKHGAFFYLKHNRLDVMEFALNTNRVNFKTFKKLLKAGAICNDNEKYMEVAVLKRDVYFVRELIKNGAKINLDNINSKNLLYQFIYSGRKSPDIVQELLESGVKTGSYFNSVSPIALAVSFYKTKNNIPPFLKLMIEYSTLEFLKIYERYSLKELKIHLNKLVDYATRCIIEAQNMKTIMIDENYSLLDYLKNFTNKNLNNSKDSNFKIQVFEIFMNKHFPIYDNLIIKLMGKEFIFYRISFLNILTFSSDSNVMFRCPDIVKKILSYSTESDVKNFILACSKRVF